MPYGRCPECGFRIRRASYGYGDCPRRPDFQGKVWVIGCNCDIRCADYTAECKKYAAKCSLAASED